MQEERPSGFQDRDCPLGLALLGNEIPEKPEGRVLARLAITRPPS